MGELISIQGYESAWYIAVAIFKLVVIVGALCFCADLWHHSCTNRSIVDSLSRVFGKVKDVEDLSVGDYFIPYGEHKVYQLKNHEWSFVETYEGKNFQNSSGAIKVEWPSFK